MTVSNRIPMDLTDPYYGQFYPGGTVPVGSTRDFGITRVHGGPGALGQFVKPRPAPMHAKTPPVENVDGRLVAAALARLRAINGMTQSDVAALLGKSVGRISHLENGYRESVLPFTVEQLAGAFGLGVGEFLAYADGAEDPAA